MPNDTIYDPAQDVAFIDKLRREESEGDEDSSRKLALILKQAWCCVCGFRIPPGDIGYGSDMCFACEMGSGDGAEF